MSEASAPQRYYIETWGCQMNVHEAERISGMLESRGLLRAPSAQDADVVLLNTCAVRDKATHKVLTEIGRLRPLKEQAPDKVLGVLGCVAQQEGEEIFRRAPHVDLVVGPRALKSLPAMLDSIRTTRRLMDLEQYADSVLYSHDSIRRDDRTRAYLTVIEGCSKSCSYCIVPYTRGREVSRPLEKILAEVRHLVASGTGEFELLGQNVNAWRQGDLDFADLLAAVDAVEGVERIRFTTSHPLHFSDRIIAAMRDLPRVCDYLHLPPQSGSDAVLKRMRRGYTRFLYLDKIARLRRAVPEVRISGDIIVGFPGEADEDFEQTMGLLEEVRFDSLFSFAYSPRPHTAAASFGEAVPQQVMAERLRRLQRRQLDLQAEINRRHLGRVYEVRLDGAGGEQQGLCGRTTHNLLVELEGRAGLLPGSLVRARVTATAACSVRGEIVDS
jgi:tRNA-2-methylthio-N6-dimethylallyladenosine synthase